MVGGSLDWALSKIFGQQKLRELQLQQQQAQGDSTVNAINAFGSVAQSIPGIANTIQGVQDKRKAAALQGAMANLQDNPDDLFNTESGPPADLKEATDAFNNVPITSPSQDVDMSGQNKWSPENEPSVEKRTEVEGDESPSKQEEEQNTTPIDESTSGVKREEGSQDPVDINYLDLISGYKPNIKGKPETEVASSAIEYADPSMALPEATAANKAKRPPGMGPRGGNVEVPRQFNKRGARIVAPGEKEPAGYTPLLPMEYIKNLLGQVPDGENNQNITNGENLGSPEQNENRFDFTEEQAKEVEDQYNAEEKAKHPKLDLLPVHGEDADIKKPGAVADKPDVQAAGLDAGEFVDFNSKIEELLKPKKYMKHAMAIADDVISKTPMADGLNDYDKQEIKDQLVLHIAQMRAGHEKETQASTIKYLQQAMKQMQFNSSAASKKSAADIAAAKASAGHPLTEPTIKDLAGRVDTIKNLDQFANYVNEHSGEDVAPENKIQIDKTSNYLHRFADAMSGTTVGEWQSVGNAGGIGIAAVNGSISKQQAAGLNIAAGNLSKLFQELDDDKNLNPATKEYLRQASDLAQAVATARIKGVPSDFDTKLAMSAFLDPLGKPEQLTNAFTKIRDNLLQGVHDEAKAQGEVRTLPPSISKGINDLISNPSSISFSPKVQSPGEQSGLENMLEKVFPGMGVNRDLYKRRAEAKQKLDDALAKADKAAEDAGIDTNPVTGTVKDYLGPVLEKGSQALADAQVSANDKLGAFVNYFKTSLEGTPYDDRSGFLKDGKALSKQDAENLLKRVSKAGKTKMNWDGISLINDGLKEASKSNDLGKLAHALDDIGVE